MTSYLFGIVDPAPFIPGYLVIMRAGHFVKARSSEGEFYVSEYGCLWALWRCHPDRAEPSRRVPVFVERLLPVLT